MRQNRVRVISQPTPPFHPPGRRSMETSQAMDWRSISIVSPQMTAQHRLPVAPPPAYPFSHQALPAPPRIGLARGLGGSPILRHILQSPAPHPTMAPPSCAVMPKEEPPSGPASWTPLGQPSGTPDLQPYPLSVAGESTRHPYTFGPWEIWLILDQMPPHFKVDPQEVVLTESSPLQLCKMQYWVGPHKTSVK